MGKWNRAILAKIMGDKNESTTRKTYHAILDKFPVLDRLIESARSSFYLLESLHKFKSRLDAFTQFGFLNTVVYEVVSLYKGHNGL